MIKHQMAKPWLFFILCLSFCVQSYLLQSQNANYHFWHLTTKEGLFSSYNLSIAQGPDGYIWLTSGNRLQRYDGQAFVTYFIEPDSFLNSQDFLPRIQLVDRNNKVWLSADTSILQFSPDTKTWKTFSICDTMPFRSTDTGNYYSTKMLQDRKGNIWMSGGCSGLFIADEAAACFKPAPMNSRVRSDYSSALVEDREGFLWFTWKAELCRYDPATHTLWHKEYNPEKHPLIGFPGQVLFLDKEDHFWLCGWTNPQLTRVHRKTGQTRKFPYNSISSFAQDRRGRVWMGRYYDKNLYCFDPQMDEIQVYPNEWWKQSGLHADEHIAHLFMDNQQNLWVLDWYKINIFRPDRQQFFVFSHDPSGKGLQLPYQEINQFLQASDGTVYVSYWQEKGGVAVLDSKLNLKKVWGWSDSSVIFPRWCWTILEDRRGHIWINQQNGHLSIFNPKTGQSKKRIVPEFQGSSPACAIRDSKDDLWFGLWRQKGLVHWSEQAQKFFHYPITSDKPWGLIGSILEDPNGVHLWLGTECGLFLFDKRSGKVINEYLPFAEKGIQKRVIITGMVYLKDGIMVLGTSEGLYRFDTKMKTGSPILTKSGKTTPPIDGAVHLDAKGNIWFSHKYGVAKYNLQTQQISLHGSDDWVEQIIYQGLRRNTFKDGRFFIGIKNYFVVFHPDSLPDAAPPSVPRITRLLLNNHDLPASHWQHGLELSHKNNFLTFHFSTLRFFDNSTQYRYRLLGLQEVWSALQMDPTATYTSLPPGQFVFQVQAVNREGMEGAITELAFCIYPPWYATWWARILFALVFMALVYLFFRYREIQRLQQEKLRLRIARDLHDDMGSTLSSISILSEAALRNLQADIDRSRFSVIGDRSRQVMDAMSDIVWSVNPRNDKMENVLQRMKEFAVEILESKGIALHFNTDESANVLNFPMELRKDFYLLFKEAVNNAAKYSGATDVWVNIRVQNKNILLDISDNGIGFDTALVKRGNGLWNMERRAERLGGTFSLISAVGQGTQIKFEFMHP